MLKYKERPLIGNLQNYLVSPANVYQKALANAELYAFLNYTTGLELEIRELNEEIVGLREQLKLAEFSRKNLLVVKHPLISNHRRRGVQQP